MSARLVLVVAILFPLAAPAQRSRSATAKCSVAGSVVRAGDNQPIKKATVFLMSADYDDKNPDHPRSYSATTEANGAFVIEGIDPGPYRLTIERNGYVLDSKARKVRILRLEPGERIRDLLLPMMAGGVVTGRVADKDGDPLPQVTVSVMQKHRPSSRSSFQYVNSAQTNDMGEYRIYQLPPGSYYVMASVARDGLPGMAGNTKSDFRYVPLYYPATSDRSQAVPLEVRGDSETRADFTMLLSPTFHVRGKVLNLPGETPRRTAVIVRSIGDEEGVPSYSGVVRQDGSFEVAGVPSGSYVAIAIAFSSKKQRVAHTELEVAQADVDGLVLRLDGGQTKVRGRLVVEGKPTFDVSRLSVVLQPTDTNRFSEIYSDMEGGGYAQVNRDGSFVVENVMPGSYSPELFSDDPGARDYYAKVIRYGTKDISDGELVVGEGSSTQMLEILVGPGGQTIEGFAMDSDGKPASGVIVVALPEVKRRRRMAAYERSLTDQQGRFVLRGVRPGDYTLLALNESEEELDFDPDFLGQLEAKGLPFRARERGRDTVTLKVVDIDTP